MDELDREEFYRLKKVSGKKQRDAAEQELQREKDKENARTQGDHDAHAAEDETETQDLLGDQDNEDVIF